MAYRSTMLALEAPFSFIVESTELAKARPKDIFSSLSDFTREGFEDILGTSRVELPLLHIGNEILNISSLNDELLGFIYSRGNWGMRGTRGSSL